MFSVLIAEDEMLVRFGLKTVIDWKQFGMEVVADVADGQAAWEEYQRRRPDLIIADIKMPVMDGMQLISKIREEDKETRIIILTCLEEFHIVRKAMSLGVSEYILKLTMTKEEMEAVLRKVGNELRSKAEPEQAKGSSFDNVKNNIMNDFLFYKIYPEQEFAKLVRRLNLRLSPERLVLCLVEIDHYESLQARFSDEHGQLIRFSMLNIFEELLKNYNRGEVFHLKDKYYMLLFSFYDVVSEMKVYEILREITGHMGKVLKTYYNATLTIGISRIQNGYGSLKAMYDESKNALEQKYFLGTGACLFINETGSGKIYNDAKSKLEKMIQELDFAGSEFKREVEVKLASWIANLQTRKEEIQKVFTAWLYWSLSAMNLNTAEASKLVPEYSYRINSSETLEGTISLYVRYLQELTAIKSKRRSISKEVAEAIQFIQNNHHKGITLKQAAEFVELSPNYLSSLFRKEVEMNFIDYLNNFRIEKAKELLLHTHQKSYKIAEMVGFSSESYFSRTFKNLTGLRPNEFRRKWAANLLEDNFSDEI